MLNDGQAHSGARLSVRQDIKNGAFCNPLEHHEALLTISFDFMKSGDSPAELTASTTL